jgi:hypothetical protein
VQPDHDTPTAGRITAGCLRTFEFLAGDVFRQEDRPVDFLAGRAGEGIIRGNVKKEANAGAVEKANGLDAAGAYLNVMQLPNQKQTEHSQKIREYVGHTDVWHNGLLVLSFFTKGPERRKEKSTS